MAAVLEHYKLTWDALSTSYRNNPVFVVDEQCVGMEPFSGNNITDGDVMANENNSEGNENAFVTSVDVNGPVTGKALEKCAAEVRELMQKIRSVTYLTKSLADLQEAKGVLNAMYKKLASSCPASEGLLLECEEESCSKAEERTTNVKARSLPTRKGNGGEHGVNSPQFLLKCDLLLS